MLGLDYTMENKTAVAKVQDSAIAILDKFTGVCTTYQQQHSERYEDKEHKDYKDEQAKITEVLTWIKTERDKVQDMEFSIGTMKAGKSTVINSIVGYDIAPIKSYNGNEQWLAEQHLKQTYQDLDKVVKEISPIIKESQKIKQDHYLAK